MSKPLSFRATPRHCSDNSGRADRLLISLRSNDYSCGIFELNKEYYDKACQRIDAERRQLSLF